MLLISMRSDISFCPAVGPAGGNEESGGPASDDELASVETAAVAAIIQ